MVTELSLALFPWGSGQKARDPVKHNALLDVRHDRPVFAGLQERTRPKAVSLNGIPVYPGCDYANDRGRSDFGCLNRLPRVGGFPASRLKASTCDHGVVSRRADYRSGCAAIKPSASARQKPPRLRRKNCAASVRSIRRPSRSGSSSPIRSIWSRSSCPNQSAPLAHRTFPPLDHAAPAPARSFQSLAERSAGPNLDGSGHQPSRCPREAVKELSAA